jgi:Gas vesicle synthesis protein GvpL/GvpF
MSVRRGEKKKGASTATKRQGSSPDNARDSSSGKTRESPPSESRKSSPSKTRKTSPASRRESSSSETRESSRSGALKSSPTRSGKSPPAKSRESPATKSRVSSADKTRESSAGGAGEGVYVYCVGEAGELGRLVGGELPEAIEAGTGLELIEGGGAGGGRLAAVGSAVPLGVYGEETLPARLADPLWVAERAMRHERVVEHFARRAGVVPLRFGTIYLRREGVVRMLAERGAVLAAAVARLRGREEWGVNAHWDRAKLAERIVELSPRLRELGERAASAKPGQAYLLRRQVEAHRADEARAEAARVLKEIERALGGASDASARLRLTRAESAEQRELAAKFAFLVERARFAEFRAEAERLAAEHAGAGLRLELTGPWPAYNFVGDA